MPAGVMVSSPVGRSSGTGYDSTSGLNLGQSSILDGPPQFRPQMDLTAATGESDILRIREDEVESKSGSENAECASDDDQDANQPPKKKRYHRHTQNQIQVMEAFFKECPHPDDKQRKELSRELGLEPLQVKFWFQNKRTQMKTQHERQENQQLRTENEKLRAENMRYREALTNASCPNCGGPDAIGEMSFDEHQLKMENARMREEIERISAIAARYLGRPQLGPNFYVPPEVYPGSFGGPSSMAGQNVFGTREMPQSAAGPSSSGVPVDKPRVVQFAVASMEEFTRVSQAGEPLWVTGPEGNVEVLNREEYLRAFPRTATTPALVPFGSRAEASRETGVMVIDDDDLLETLMDASKWSMMFSSIVSRVATLEVLSADVSGNYNGALHVVYTHPFSIYTPLKICCLGVKRVRQVRIALTLAWLIAVPWPILSSHEIYI